MTTNQSTFDEWTVPHGMIGFAAGILQIPYSKVIVICSIYELAEHQIESGPNPFGTAHPEHIRNVLGDLAVMTLGYYLASKL